MNVRELYERYLELTDESLEGEQDAAIESHLGHAYAEFQEIGLRLNPYLYTDAVTFALADQASYPLYMGTTTIMGPSVGAPPPARCRRILAFGEWDASLGEFIPPYFDKAPTVEILCQKYRSYCLAQWTLMFSERLTGDYGLIYVPFPSVDWTKHAVGDAEYVDDYWGHHELIVYLAWKRYAAANQETNPMAMAEMERLIIDWEEDARERVRGVTKLHPAPSGWHIGVD